MNKHNAYIEVGRYRIYHDEKKGVFEIYEVIGKKIDSFNNIIDAKNKVEKLNEEDEKIIELNAKANELNAIKEPERDRRWKNIMPVNDNFALNSSIAKATRELLGKEK